jgi:hypothetical protein
VAKHGTGELDGGLRREVAQQYTRNNQEQYRFRQADHVQWPVSPELEEINRGCSG